MTTSIATSEFDDLARLVNGGLRNGVTPDDFLKCRLGNNSIGEYVADAIVRAGYRKPRTITTVEELDALPDGSFIVTEQGGYWQADKRGHGEIWWLEPGNPRSSLSEDLTLPGTVLWEPEA